MENDNRVFLNNLNEPLRCKANGYKPQPPPGMFFSEELNKKYDERTNAWLRLWRPIKEFHC